MENENKQNRVRGHFMGQGLSGAVCWVRGVGWGTGWQIGAAECQESPLIYVIATLMEMIVSV